MFGGLYKLYMLDLSAGEAANKAASILEYRWPLASKALREIGQVTNPDYTFETRSLDDWAGGAGVLMQSSVVDVTENRVVVGSAKQFVSALRSAKEGDTIVLAKGTYRLNQKRIPIGHAGTSKRPVRVTAEKIGDVVLQLNSLEGFYVNQPYWVFENLKIEGVCKTDSQCEHAFHITGGGHHFTARNNIISDFNAHFKVNGSKVNGTYSYPDSGLLEKNNLYNSWVRDTSNSVTLIDSVAVNDWVVRGNFIADIVKGKGNKVSYAAFFKGYGSDNVFEQNLIVCQFNLNSKGGAQVGLSFGGGGTAKKNCRDDSCAVEHLRGTIRNNIIMNCNDVGVYLNQASQTEVYNNTLINTLGIDVRFAKSTAVVANNILSGRIKLRNGGTAEQYANFTFDVDDVKTYFLDPFKGSMGLLDSEEIKQKGIPLIKDEYDFCGNKRRSGPVDIGAIEYGVNSLCRLF